MAGQASSPSRGQGRRLCRGGGGIDAVVAAATPWRWWAANPGSCRHRASIEGRQWVVSCGCLMGLWYVRVFVFFSGRGRGRGRDEHLIIAAT